MRPKFAVKVSIKPALRRKPREVVERLTAAARRKIRRHPRPAKPQGRSGAHEALLGLRRFVANPLRARQSFLRWPKHRAQ